MPNPWQLSRVKGLIPDSTPAIVKSVGGTGKEELTGLNLSEMALIYNGSLFIADTGFDRVLIWMDIEDTVAWERLIRF